MLKENKSINQFKWAAVKALKKAVCMAAVIAVAVTPVSAYELSDKQIIDLKSYSIMIGDGDESGDLRQADNVTRAEFAKMLCTAAKLDQTEEETVDIILNDVSPEHWAYKYISLVNQKGIMVGDENGNFNPDSNITNQDAIVMIVRLLGYEPVANLLGGYPLGYLQSADRYKIIGDAFDGLAVDENSKRSEAGAMIANALDVPMMEVNTPYNKESDSTDLSYVICDGKSDYPLKTLRTLQTAK